MRWQTQELYFRQMLAQKLGIPIMGRIVFAVPNDSSTSMYGEYFRRDLEIPGDLIFQGTNAVLNAYNSLSAYRNDVVMVAPGAHALTAELVWSKSNTHLVGLAGPNVITDYSEPGVSIYTTTANVDDTVDLTGNYCQFHGANFTNYADDADNLSAFNVNGYGAYFENCSFHGIMGTTQLTTVVCASLYISGLGSNYLFKNCVIGQNQWGVRSGALQAHLRYVNSASAPASANGRFEDCLFLSQSETVTCAMVALPNVLSTDRFHLFKGCTFTNFSVNWGIRLNQVFYNPAGMETTNVLLQNCAAYGFDEWQDSDLGTMYESNMPVATVGGGLAKEPTAVAS